MANYETIRFGTLFRENSMQVLDAINEPVDVDLLVKGHVIYLFDCKSKTLLKEILIARNFSVEAGSDSLSITLRDDTKEVVLKASTENSRTNCLENLRRLAANASPALAESKKPEPPLDEEVTVIFRRPPPPSFLKNASPSVKHKYPPPPTAPKPIKTSASLPSKIQATPSKDAKDLVPCGTVKSISRELARVLFTNPFSNGSNKSPNQASPVEKHKVEKKEANSYESFNPIATSERYPSRIPSDPRMEDEMHGKLDLASRSEGDIGNSFASFDDDQDNQPESGCYIDDHLYDNQIHLGDRPVTIRHEDISPDGSVTKFNDDGDMYASNIEIRRPWLMRGNQTRQDSVKALQGKPDGAFIVRSRDGNSDAHVFPYALTVLYKGQPMHMQIQRTENAGLVLAPWTAGEKSFDTLDELVQYYRDNRIAFAYQNVQGFISLQKGNFTYG